MAKRGRERDPGLEAAQSLGFIVGACICLILSLVFAATLPRRTVASPFAPPNGRINPNEASMASLARLPGIGPTRARAIVALREQEGLKPVFRSAEDLARVKGIGPATIEGLRPWLDFNPPAAQESEPPAR